MCTYLFSAVLGQARGFWEPTAGSKDLNKSQGNPDVCVGTYFKKILGQAWVSGDPQQALKTVRIVKEIYRGV